MTAIVNLAEDIWIIDGVEVPWFGMPYTTRTTIVRLPSGGLWVHSPGMLTDELASQVEALGLVMYLISPNKIHHLFMADWKFRFPDAKLYASPGLREKRKDIAFDKDLGDSPDGAWGAEIDQLIFKGSPVMEEVVFFHRSSKTLILTDLIENFPPDHFAGHQKFFARMAGIVSPNGRTPLDWRLTFLIGKSQAKKSLDRMLSWHPERIIISHGENIHDDAPAFLRRSFSWV